MDTKKKNNENIDRHNNQFIDYTDWKNQSVIYKNSMKLSMMMMMMIREF